MRASHNAPTLDRQDATCAAHFRPYPCKRCTWPRLRALQAPAWKPPRSGGILETGTSVFVFDWTDTQHLGVTCSNDCNKCVHVHCWVNPPARH